MTTPAETTSQGILDAATAVFEQYGARRANVEDIARAAGVSRSTLYRAYPTKDALLEAALLRQLDTFLAELDRVAADLSPREAVVECFAHGLRLTREVPLIARLSHSEPEVISQIGLRQPVSLLLSAGDRVAATLRAAGATLPEEELHTVAELMLRVAYSFLLDPSGHLDVTDEAAARDYARRYLSPLVR